MNLQCYAQNVSSEGYRQIIFERHGGNFCGRTESTFSTSDGRNVLLCEIKEFAFNSRAGLESRHQTRRSW